MNIEEALDLVDKALKPERLNDLQELVFRESWEGKTYQEIGWSTGYDNDYIRLVGFQLWQALSDAFGEKVTKNNFRSILRQQKNLQLVPLVKTQEQLPFLELPQGPVSLDSPFYVERSPIEERCYQEILKPGALIRLRAASKMGKTSLQNRILAYAGDRGYRTVRFNFQQADETVLSNVNRFLRWFCANIARQLHLEPNLDNYWDEDFGSKISCTIYFQAYILEQVDTALVLGLDELNQLFEYPEIAQNFLPLLRSWYEEAKYMEIWQKLRFIVVHSTEIYVPLNINQSPFNVGWSVRLPEFTKEQVRDLAVRHGLDWLTEAEAEQLMLMVGGHPYRVRLAFYRLALEEIGLEQLLAEAPTLAGIYSDHLRQCWTTLQQHQELMEALQQVVTTEGGVQMEPIPAYELESMGLVKLNGDEAVLSCDLYRLYFRSQL